MPKRTNLTIVIPTYQREKVLLDTIDYLLRLDPTPCEILIMDQTLQHDPEILDALERYESEKAIRWIRLRQPSITQAMNAGLGQATSEFILFLDDDIIPASNLIAAHLAAQAAGYKLIAGQVLQPGEEFLMEPAKSRTFRFNSTRKQIISEFIGCNFSVDRRLALALGGFDENFVNAAYRYEAEFADRALTAGERILFEPSASIRHLKAGSGGIRSYGNYLTTARPSHTVGAYYCLLRSQNVSGRLLKLLIRPLRAIRTKHHFTHPWWIPATLISETMGFVWAVFLYLRGPRLLNQSEDAGRQL